MTIVVGVAAPDGLILAADSRTTFMPGGSRGRTRVGSDSVQKVFPLYGRYGVACYGAMFVDGKTVGGQMDEFEASTPEPANIGELTSTLGAFFEDRIVGGLAASGKPWRRGQRWQLGFLAAGYDDSRVGHLVDVRVPESEGPGIFPSGASTADIGVAWRGQDDVINRLVGGVDSNTLFASGVHVSDALHEALASLEYNLMRPITAQDAVDWATFLIRTTVEMQRFSDGTRAQPGGVPGCGGVIRILHVTRRGVEWVSRPALSAGMSQLGGL